MRHARPTLTALLVAVLLLPASPALAAPPANDAFVDATLFNPTAEASYSTTGANSGASMQSGEPTSGGVTASSVWFRLPPGTIGDVTLDTAGSGFDTVLAVWRGHSLDDLTLVAANDDASGSVSTSSVAFEIDARRNYWVQLGSKASGGTGTYSLAGTFDGRVQRPGIVSYHPGPWADGQGHVNLYDIERDELDVMARFATTDGWQTHQVGDLDGDGTTSLYSYFPGPDGNGRGRWWQTNLATGKLSRLTDFGTATGWQSHLIADLDGDGVEEIVSFFPGNGTWWRTRVRDGVPVQDNFTTFGTRDGWQQHQVADMNGDGRDEILSYFPGNGSWWQTEIRGDGTAVQTMLTTYGTRTGWQEHLVADVSGDDTPELLSFHPGSGRWWQTDVSTSTARQSILTTYGDGDGLAGADWTAHLAGDINYDGKHDLVSLDSSTGNWWWTRDFTSGDRTVLVQYIPGDGFEGHDLTQLG